MSYSTATPQLVDQLGNPMASVSHSAASLSSKDFRQWQPPNLSADADLLGERSTLVARSRDLNRNNGVAAGYTQTVTDNVVGIGLRLSAKPEYLTLGKDKAWADEWSKQVEALWRLYANSLNFDAAGRLNFHGATTQVFKAGITDGESLAIPMWLNRPQVRYRTAFKIIDADRLSNPNNAPDTERRRQGIDTDRHGGPKMYHIRNRHPGDSMGLLTSADKWTPIPARTRFGRRKVIHIHDAERAGQSRGKPVLASVMTPFKMVDHYHLIELKTSIVNSMIAAFVESNMDAESAAELIGGGAPEYIAERGEWEANLEGGRIIQLPIGDRLAPFAPNRPAAAFNSFVESTYRQIAAGLHIPYELLLKDFSKTNYSSARAALLEAWRFFLGRRQWLTTYWANPVYELWLEEVVNRGFIEAPGFYENKDAYCACRWIGPGRGWVDPVKEAAASKLRRESLVSTLEAECAEQGKDWEEVLEQLAKEKKQMADLGITETDIAAMLHQSLLSDDDDQPKAA